MAAADREGRFPSSRPSSWPSRVPTPRESERESEFLKYFQPLRDLTPEGPKFADVRDPVKRSEHIPISCPDKTLTALCQLGALRLNARRAMVFMFATNAAHILAEATRTLSLEVDEIHEPGDQLWMGYSVIPREIACCEITVNLPAFSQLEVDDGRSLLAIDDLSRDPRTDYLPYVNEYPNARSYYGVPITTPAGINIGAYCILDDRPRDGISYNDTRFLQEMSKTIMNHLISIRAQAENLRSIQMVNGLRAFVQGSSTSRDWRKRLAKKQVRAAPAKSAPHKASHLATEVISTTGHDDDIKSAVEGMGSLGMDQKSLKSHSRSQFHGDQIPLPSSTNGLNPMELSAHIGGPPTDKKLKPAPSFDSDAGSDLPPSDTETFQRAATLMREALSLDGVMFFDAAVGISDRLSDTASTSTTGESSESDGSLASDTEDVSLGTAKSTGGNAAGPGVPCRVLGSSLRTRAGLRTHNEAATTPSVHDCLLRELLRRYPYGKIWNFDERGVVYANEARRSSQSKYSGAERQLRHQQRGSCSESRREGGLSDSERIQQVFPGARSVAFHGMWDTTRHRWSAACLLCSYDDLRHVDVDTDLNFVAAFSDVVLADTKRTQSEFTEKAKSTFISSVSHELRSPLHGILGSAEVLQEYSMDSAASSLVHQIETCGQNLLDIIDHILDFAKLRDQKLKRNAVKSSRIGRTISSESVHARSGDELAALDVSIDLADLTEEIVETTVYSHYCSTVFQRKPRITTILDVDRGDGLYWHCRLAKGGWKRVLMNLVINALKYTQQGYVHVSLKQEPVPGSRRRFKAILTVADTGQGMSADFLENHYFRAFVQQDMQTDGMGLGMSMVRRIIHAMGAQIDIKSDQVGGGTQVTVTIPLERSQESVTHDANEKVSLRGSFAGLRAGIVSGGMAPSADAHSRSQKLQAKSIELALLSLQKGCRYLGLEDRPATWWHDSETAVDFCVEAQYAATVKSQLRSTRARAKPLIVLCDSALSERRLRDWARSEDFSTSVVEYLTLPCGVRSLHAALSSALRRRSPSHVTTEADATTSAHAIHEASGDGHLTGLPSSAEPIVQALERDAKRTDRGEVGSPTTGAAFLQEGREYPFTPTKQQQATRILSPIASPSSAMTTAARPSEPCMLLVDDNPINLRLLVTYAKKRNIPYTTAVDGRNAVEAYQSAYRHSRGRRSSIAFSQPATPITGPASESEAATTTVPEVILMDINMPVMDGYEATRRIRAYEQKHRLKAAKIVALTALGSTEAADAAFGSGVDHFLTKPVQFKDLTCFLKELMEKD